MTRNTLGQVFRNSPTGDKTKVSQISIGRFENGKIVGLWDEQNMLGGRSVQLPGLRTITSHCSLS